MNNDDLSFLKDWFSKYCKSFYSSNVEDQRNIHLKEEHTYKVCENIVQIAKEESLNQNEIMLAETVALFHDVGRFSQYARYKTFRDGISVNHGRLGAEILQSEKLLQNFPEDEQSLIIDSVKFHNAFNIPDLKNPKMIFFLKLIRDADKLDIWRVFTEFYEKGADEKASAVSLGLSNTPDYSKDILSCLYKKQIASLTNLKVLNDFKLLQLSWIFDLHFMTTFRLLSERDYISKIAARLPQKDEIKKAVILLKEFVYQRLKEKVSVR